jgi:glycosyltransferase involved in cell wall biosynthesis
VLTRDASECFASHEGETAAWFITITACTHRRLLGLRALLDGIGRQRFVAIPPPRLAVVIADNEGSDDARAACESFARTAGIPVTYVRELRRGIPWARNAGLDHLDDACDFLALIDDDEVPEPDWLEQLVLAQQASGADVVQGRVVPRFPDVAPRWIREGSFFGWPASLLGETDAVLEDGQPLSSAATNNTLVRRAALGEPPLRFDTRFPLLGWDDALFFRTLHRRGARIVFGDRARVNEIVPPERARFGYLLRVAYRQGNKKLGIKLAFNKADARPAARAWLTARTVARGVAGIAAGVAALAIAPLRGGAVRRRTATAALRVAGGVGMLASVGGVRFEHYR